MKKRIFLFATCATAGLLGAFSGQAMPSATPHAVALTGAATPVDYREHRDDDDQGEHHRGKHDRHGENRERDHSASRHDDDDDDDDDGEDGRGATPAMQQNAMPPVNGLFAPGSKPRVQMN